VLLSLLEVSSDIKRPPAAGSKLQIRPPAVEVEVVVMSALSEYRPGYSALTCATTFPVALSNPRGGVKRPLPDPPWVHVKTSQRTVPREVPYERRRSRNC